MISRKQAACLALHWLLSANPNEARTRAKEASALPPLCALLQTHHRASAPFAAACLRLTAEIVAGSEGCLWVAVADPACGLGRLAAAAAEAHPLDCAVHVVRF